MHTVFVYGTLRKTGIFHNVLANSEFFSDAKTADDYAMYFRSYPHVTSRVAHTQVIGEVYKVNDRVLEDLDRLEGHPSYYRRRLVNVVLKNGQKVKAHMYFCDGTEKQMNEIGPEIMDGDFIRYMG